SPPQSRSPPPVARREERAHGQAGVARGAAQRRAVERVAVRAERPDVHRPTAAALPTGAVGLRAARVQASRFRAGRGPGRRLRRGAGVAYRRCLIVARWGLPQPTTRVHTLGYEPNETLRSIPASRYFSRHDPAPEEVTMRYMRCWLESKSWWSGGGSNSRPSHCERDALPAELPPRGGADFTAHSRYDGALSREAHMQISPPFGYTEVVPFLKTQKVRLLGPGQVPPFVQQGNAVPISHTEFQPIARHYPIVFTSGDAGKSFAAVAVLGLGQGENLFYADGKWASGSYIPAYARRYPFCMARVNVNKVEQKDRLICVEKSMLDDAGESMFDKEGKPSE